MGSLFRRTYTDKKTGKSKMVKKWYGEYIDGDGIVQRVALSPNRSVSQTMLTALELKAQRRRAGIVDHFESHREKSILDHLADFQAELESRERDPKHIRTTVGRIHHLLVACGVATVGDITPERVVQQIPKLRADKPIPHLDNRESYTAKELAELLGTSDANIVKHVRQHRLATIGENKTRRYPAETAEMLRDILGRGLSKGTVFCYIRDIKTFTRWLVANSRLAANPLAGLNAPDVRNDQRHGRRSLTADEIRLLIGTTAKSATEYRGLGGTDRAALYTLAVTTGFRCGELAILTPERFDLEGELPCVRLSGSETKNGQSVVQPIPSGDVARLRTFLEAKEPGQPVWPGTWHQRASEMVYRDLEECGIPHVVDSQDGPLFVDFHSLRHSFVAMLDLSGASVKQAMQLARHSDPKLTMARYGRIGLNDLATTVDNLPSFAPGPKLGRTGTE